MPVLGISFVSMGRIRDFLKQFVVDRQRKPAPNVQELRADFRARYHKFKLILDAANKSLEVMVTIEQALQGRRSFATSFIKTRGMCDIRHMSALDKL
jgi:pyruvate,water dikinase